MKEIQERVGGGPVTVEGDTFRQNTFSNICLYLESAHKTIQGIFNFQLCLLMKWATVQGVDCRAELSLTREIREFSENSTEFLL